MLEKLLPGDVITMSNTISGWGIKSLIMRLAYWRIRSHQKKIYGDDYQDTHAVIYIGKWQGEHVAFEYTPPAARFFVLINDAFNTAFGRNIIASVNKSSFIYPETQNVIKLGKMNGSLWTTQFPNARVWRNIYSSEFTTKQSYLISLCMEDCGTLYDVGQLLSIEFNNKKLDWGKKLKVCSAGVAVLYTKILGISQFNIADEFVAPAAFSHSKNFKKVEF